MSNQTPPREKLTDENEFLRIEGDQAREHNISAARGVVEAVRATYGPRGLDKMLVSLTGDIDVTNDGVTVLNGLEIDHPAAQILVEVARTQRDEAGDGTTTAVLFAGTLLREAEELMEAGVHPTVIVDGFHAALDQALEEMSDLGEDVDASDEEILRQVATTSLSGKSVETNAEVILPLLLEAVQSVTVDGFVDFEYLKIKPQIGQGIAESVLVDGVALDEGPSHEAMPHEVDDADVLLLDEPIQPEETTLDVRASFNSHDRRIEFLDREERHLKKMVGQIEDVDADVVFCWHRIDERAQQYLADRDILAVEHLEQSEIDFEFLREVLDAPVVSDLDQITATDLGHGTIRRDRGAGCIYAENQTTHGASLVLHGTSEHVVDELERSVKNTLDVLARTISDGRVAGGGGAIEIEVAARLREYADGVGGPQQLAVHAFANTLEIVPRVLASNAGLDPIDILTSLRNAHASGSRSAGLNAFNGEITDTFEAGIIEPAYVKEQAILSATQTAILILQIDGVISAKKLSAANGENNADGVE